ncbi:Bifunctional dihydroflavonol 4-reductase/flavanone 4-reductase [Colletotrichum gloeosporioides]|uniref:Bifunctional dihydroflavonol 4-reductase/flavanone 4-reductase n=1 Tax=Colletotrichum gloeosporioides TaxID=474922 RepID=A0A8H4CDW3_COLGL|nr:Bifunctional dihydroflavonol 4-reductase/flavanone 4-reductase [Colletotrichum gloeosporioides]KAF3802213.1 Bifunctional dihydroflavonol 4-reductase/flavanone 4-reductase [Colletotrichum gloeosporioides]
MEIAETHLVTGGSGFIAQHLVNELLSQGIRVNATVRSLRNAKKVVSLNALQEKHEGRLQLFEADLLKPGSFEEAMQGCSVVHHVASPFMMAEMIKDGQKECVEPALEGTRNVLASVKETTSVKRVVLTSTIGAIFGDYEDVNDKMGGTLSEKYFNETSTVTHNPYHYSKVLAEKEAWEIAKEESRWDLVVVCPGLVLGPPLSAASDSGSLFLIDELLSGKLFFGVPNLNFATVDVREVVMAHIKVASTPTASGRYIVASRDMTHFLEISKLFRSLSKSMLIPDHLLPDFLVRVIGPLFGLTRKWISRNLGTKFAVDNSRSIKELGIKYRPLETTLREHYQAWKG